MSECATVDLLIEAIDEEVGGPLTREGVELVRRGWIGGHKSVESQLTTAQAENEALRARVAELESEVEFIAGIGSKLTKAATLRKQAEAVDEVNRLLTTISEEFGGAMDACLVMQYAASAAGEEATRLRNRADEREQNQ